MIDHSDQSRQIMHEWPSPCKAKLPIFKVTGDAKIIILRCFQRVLTQPKHGYSQSQMTVGTTCIETSCGSNKQTCT